MQANVVSGAKDFGITYPVAMDNAFSTWTNYRNRYWPAHYLIDQQGTVRHIEVRRGRLRRHRKADPPTAVGREASDLPPAIDALDTTPTQMTHARDVLRRRQGGELPR